MGPFLLAGVGAGVVPDHEGEGEEDDAAAEEGAAGGGVEDEHGGFPCLLGFMEWLQTLFLKSHLEFYENESHSHMDAI